MKTLKTIIETERLLLREFDQSDAIHFYQLNADPEVIRYTGDPPFASVEAARVFLENYQDYQKNGYGRWVVLLKSNDEFIGFCGLKFNELELVDLGFRFFKKHWNKGYATESARACLEYGFRQLQLEEIIGRAAKDNTASIRVLEKLGMSYWKDAPCKGILNSAYYRINKTAFKNSRF